ncbi:MAG: hypothetical protein JSU77_02390 [Fidelibacterota bacterium]|nr:MAG: hypothetical protein JSU77_02390 [Candidatus Neomarinimicrobiota bacterium]
MAGIKDIIDSVSGWLRALIDFGLAVILVFVIIDILFPGTTGIIGNIETIVGSFADKGVVGLIALLLFLLVYKK